MQTYSGHGLYVYYVYANLRFYEVAVTIKYCISQLIFSIDQEKHDFKSLKSLKEEVNTYFSTQLKVISEQITKISSLDKKVWNDLDDQEQKCSDVIREIETVRDEMVSD